MASVYNIQGRRHRWSGQPQIPVKPAWTGFRHLWIAQAGTPWPVDIAPVRDKRANWLPTANKPDVGADHRGNYVDMNNTGTDKIMYLDGDWGPGTKEFTIFGICVRGNELFDYLGGVNGKGVIATRHNARGDRPAFYDGASVHDSGLTALKTQEYCALVITRSGVSSCQMFCVREGGSVEEGTVFFSAADINAVDYIWGTYLNSDTDNGSAKIYAAGILDRAITHGEIATILDYGFVEPAFQRDWRVLASSVAGSTTHEAALTLAIEAGLTNTKTAILGAGITFATQLADTHGKVANFESSASYSLITNATYLGAVLGDIEGALTLALTIAQNSNASAILGAAQGFNLQLDAITSGGLLIADAITYAVTMGDAATSTISIEGSLTASIDLGETSSAIANLESSITLDQLLTFNAVANGILNAGLDLSCITGVSVDGSVITLGLTAPDGRTINVRADSRATIPKIERGIDVKSDSRTITVKVE